MSALVLLHGFTGSPASWAPVLEHLPVGHRTLRPALLGHRGSSSNATSFDDEVARLADLLEHDLADHDLADHDLVRRDLAEHEGLPRPHLVGYSLGARIALALLIRHRHLFARATLIGVNPGLVDPEERATRRDLDEARASKLEREGLAAFVDAWEREPIFATQRSLPSDVRARHRAIRTSHDPRELARSLRTLGLGSMPSFWDALPSIRTELTLITGSADTKLEAIAQRMLPMLSNARHLRVEGAGHDVGLERPEQLARALARGPASEAER